MILYYIRHADPIYDPDSITPLGHRQAESVGRRIGRLGVSRIFASSSNRAIQTATPASEILKKPIEVLDWCNESFAWRDMAVEREEGGRTWCFRVPRFRELFCRPDVLSLGMKWYTHELFADTPFANGMQRVEQACDEWLGSLGYRHDRSLGIYRAEAPSASRIALFAHQGLGLMLLSALLDIPYPYIALRTDITTTSVSAIDFAGTDTVIPRMFSMANDGHLYADGLPTHV